MGTPVETGTFQMIPIGAAALPSGDDHITSLPPFILEKAKSSICRLLAEFSGQVRFAHDTTPFQDNVIQRSIT